MKKKQIKLKLILVYLLCIALLMGTLPASVLAEMSPPTTQETSTHRQETQEAVTQTRPETDAATQAEKSKKEVEPQGLEDPTKCTEVGKGTEKDPYELSNEDQIIDLSKTVSTGQNFSNQYFIVKNDIELTETFTPIGTGSYYFSGVLDGNEKKITATVEDTTTNRGFFGRTQNAVIKNLTFAGAVSGSYNVGGLIGYSTNSKVINCVNEADITVTGTNNGSGGLIGYASGTLTLIKDSINKGAVQDNTTNYTSMSVGGILGNGSGKTEIDGCINEGKVTTGTFYSSYVGHGGIVGTISAADSIITDSTNKGELVSRGGGNLAGIIGYVGAVMDIKNCSNEGKISGPTSNKGDYTGGIVGTIYYAAATVSDCFNKGEVISGGSNSIGGVIGNTGNSNPTIKNCYNAGSVKNKYENTSAVTGGVVGRISSSATKVQNCYSYGEIAGGVSNETPSQYTGGVIGAPYSTTINTAYISDNKYLEETAEHGIGNIEDADGVCSSFDESEKGSGLIEDLGNAYQTDLAEKINNGYPILRWQNPEAMFAVDFTVKDKETGNKLNDYTIAVDGFSPDGKGIYQLGKGNYDYSVTKAGYGKITGSFTISKSAKTIPIELTATKHQYAVKVSPADAKLVVTNKVLDRTIANPKAEIDEEGDVATYEFELADKDAYGEYSYHVDKYTYDAMKGTISASAEGTETITLAKSNVTEVTFNIEPKDAKVTVKNTEYGASSTAKSNGDGVVKYDLVDSEFSYSVKAAGHRTKNGSFVVPDETDMTVSLSEKSTWDGTADTDWYDENTNAKEYFIGEPEELAGLAVLVNEGSLIDFSGKTITMTKDMDLGSVPWKSIGSNNRESTYPSCPFKGTFNGAGHSITGIKLNGKQRQGLFGEINAATIKNLKIDVDVDVTTVYTGGLASSATNSNISDITVNGKIKSTAAYVGGIAGEAKGCTITNCENNADITGYYQVGGIVGMTGTPASTISKSFNTGEITGTINGTTNSYSIGGIVGILYAADDTVKYCYNTGDISGSIRSMGGVVGAVYNYSGKAYILNSYNTGNITDEYESSQIGGIVGYTYNNEFNIRNCYSRGTLSAVTVGGIVGYPYSTNINTGYTSDNYYLENEGYVGSGRATEDAAGAYESFEKKNDSDYSTLIENLGASYKADIKLSDGDGYKYNDGFPILRLQDPDSLYNARFSISYDKEDNKGETGPTIIVNNSDNEAQTAGKNGSYELPNGDYTYSINEKGYGEEKGAFTINSESLEKSISLIAKKYEYKVIAEEGDVVLTKDGTEITPQSHDKDSGTYTFELYNGTYSYTAKRFGFQKEKGQFEVEYANGSREINFSEKPLHKIAFNVTAPDGAAFLNDDPIIMIYSAEEDFKGKLIASYDKNDLIKEGIKYPEGDYTYKIKAEGFNTETGSFTIDGKGEIVEKELALKNGWGGLEDVDTDWYTNHKDQEVYTLKNESELAGLAKLVNEETSNFAGKTIKIAANMDMKDGMWTPIGAFDAGSNKYFSGTFDGNGHSVTINEMDLSTKLAAETNTNGSQAAHCGLFGYLNGAKIKNLTMRGSINQDYVKGDERITQILAGGISGYANNGTRIENCSNQMNINIDAGASGGLINMGGLVGWALQTTFESSNNISKISAINTTGTCAVGGIVGYGNYGSASLVGEISNCYNTGAISAKGNSETVGGIAARFQANAGTMKNSYSTGAVSADKVPSNAKPLVSSILYGTYSNNHYLNTLGTDSTANSFPQTDEYMRSGAFAEKLGDAFAINSKGGYPILAWEKSVDHLVITQNPKKIKYEDMEDFDDTGLKITAYMSENEDDGVELAAGWSISNGKSLKPTQKSVTIEYKGAKVTCPIQVEQVVHQITDNNLVFKVKAPVVGEDPQEAISLSDTQKSKFKADLKWTKAGKPFAGKFEKATYYRAELTLTSTYKKDDVYYAFEKYAEPSLSEAYDIVDTKVIKNDENENTVVKSTITFKATTSATEGLTDKISHLYYAGDSLVDYGKFLENKLTISGGSNKEDIVLSVEDLEYEVLKRDLGHQGVYNENSEFAGIKLYRLLLENGLDQNASDETKIRVYGITDEDFIDITVGQLRSAGEKTPIILAYGNATNETPLASAKGPLCLVRNSGKGQENITKIAIIEEEKAQEHMVTFKVNVDDPQITVEDSYHNAIESTKDAKIYALRNGETYHYTVEKQNYTVESGTIKVDGKDQIIPVTLTPAWDGKTYTKPEQVDRVYQIGTPAELMWWNKNGTKSDNVRLTADIALNNGVSYENGWPTLFGNREENAYTGTFDGNGHVITGFYIDRENTYELEVSWTGVIAFADRISQIGLFGYAKDATIKNLGVEGKINVFDRPDSMYADWLQIGGLVGYAHGSTKITNCYTNLGIVGQASMETETVGGYPVAGYADACDTYIGGIVGSLSGSAKVENCYSKGSFIGANTRTINLGGIVGGLRSNGTNVDKSYSTAKLQAVSLPSSNKDSFVGGIAGDANGILGKGSVANSFGLNRGILGDNDKCYYAGRVTGNESDTNSNNHGLVNMKVDGVNYEGSASATGMNGADIYEEAAKSSTPYTGSNWSNESWSHDQAGYPMLKWQKKPAGEDINAVYNESENPEEGQWDGYFGSENPPPYFKLYFRVNGHDKKLAKTFTAKEMKQMALDDNEGNLHYSAKSYGGNAGRFVREYVYLDTLFKNAGLSFKDGDALLLGLGKLNYTDLMSDRYYYPEWANDSNENAVAVKPILALKSYGASYGVDKDSWSYFASQADYLYAYMLTFGQKTPTEDTYGKFIYQQTEATVDYDPTAAANETVKSLLSDAIQKAQDNKAGTEVADDATDVLAGLYYVSQGQMDAFSNVISGVTDIYQDSHGTNGRIMTALEALEEAEAAFDKAKKKGGKVDNRSLESLIEIVQRIIASTTESDKGDTLSEDVNWATKEELDVLKSALAEAKALESDASQKIVDRTEFMLKSALEDFFSKKGQLEPLAREAAIDALTQFVNDLDENQYRESEWEEIKSLLEAGKKQIGAAKTLEDISQALAEAKASINSVKTELMAIRGDAKRAVESYVDLNDYERTERIEVKEIIAEYQDAIEKAATKEDVEELVTKAKLELSKVKTAASKKAETELQEKKKEAVSELETYYEKIDKYSTAEQVRILSLILNNIKKINAAETADEVKAITVQAKIDLGKIKTIAQKNAAAKAAFIKKKVTVKKLKKAKKKATISWSKVSGAKGYQIFNATNKSFSKGKRITTIKSGSVSGKTITKLKSKRTYHFKVRAYTVIDGKKVYTTWSKSKQVKVK